MLMDDWIVSFISVRVLFGAITDCFQADLLIKITTNQRNVFLSVSMKWMKCLLSFVSAHPLIDEFEYSGIPVEPFLAFHDISIVLAIERLCLL